MPLKQGVTFLEEAEDQLIVGVSGHGFAPPEASNLVDPIISGSTAPDKREAGVAEKM